MLHRLVSLSVCLALSAVVVSCSSSSVQSVRTAEAKQKIALQVPYYLPKALVTVDVSKEQATTVQEGTVTNMPCGTTKTEFTESTGPTEKRVVATSIRYCADEEALRFAQYKDNFWYDDLVTIKTNEAGLLETSTADSTDRSPQVVVKLAEAATDLTELFAKIEGRSASPTTPPEEWHFTFDPLHPEDVEEKLKDTELKAELLPGTTDTTNGSRQGYLMRNEESRKGLHFRGVKYLYLYDISQGEEGRLIEKYAIPDPDMEYAVPLPRKSLTSAKSTLEIHNGMLQSFTIDKKSQFLAAASIPVDILDAFCSAFPKGLFVYQQESKAEAIRAETALIEAQATLEAARSGQSK